MLESMPLWPPAVSLLPFLLHLLEQIGVVLSPSYRVWMIGAKHLFSYIQGWLQERLCLLVLILPPVEHCQFIQGGCCRGMLRSLHLLTDGQGTLEERLGLLVLALIHVEHCQGMQG